MHKSQGFGNFAGGRGGARSESFTLLAGEPAATDIMDGVDTTWKRYNIAEPISTEKSRPSPPSSILRIHPPASPASPDLESLATKHAGRTGLSPFRPWLSNSCRSARPDR